MVGWDSKTCFWAVLLIPPPPPSRRPQSWHRRSEDDWIPTAGGPARPATQTSQQWTVNALWHYCPSGHQNHGQNSNDFSGCHHKQTRARGPAAHSQDMPFWLAALTGRIFGILPRKDRLVKGKALQMTGRRSPLGRVEGKPGGVQISAGSSS
jgi:hypothetical protein